MSDMLEQAVIDAAALKEVALKNAEEAVIEKYSREIKEAVDQLLEQDDVLDMGLGLEEPADEESLDMADNLPLAATDGEDLCPCPDADEAGEPETVEIDFTELGPLSNQMEDLGTQSHAAAAEEVFAAAPPAPMAEEIDFDLGELKELVEDLTVDVKPVPTGWGNNGVPNSELEEMEDQALANAQDTEVKEELEELKKTLEELEESKNNLQKRLDNSNSGIEDLQEAVEFLKNKLNETNLVSAKLLFKNKALMNPSLNERQKNKIVEALSNASSVEETKTIYEALQSGVSTSNDDKKHAESLSEAVNKVSSTMVLTRNEKVEKREDSTLGRWKTLAGLNKI